MSPFAPRKSQEERVVLYMMSSEMAWKDLEEQAHEAYSQGLLDEALDIYKKQVELAKDQPEQLASAHKSMGLILHDRGDWEASLAELNEGLRIQLSIPDRSDDVPFQLSIANTYINIAEVYRSMENLELSLGHFQEALRRHVALAPDSLLLAETYNSIGLVFGEVGNIKMALDCHTACFEIRTKLCPNTLTASCSASNIGLILYKMGKLESALFYLQKALDMEQVLIPNTLDLADSFSNVAEVLFKMGQHQESLDKFQVALQLKIDISPHSLDVAKTHFDVGWVLLTMKQASQAQQHFQEAIDLEEHFIPDSKELAHAYESLMKCLQYQGLPIPEDLVKKRDSIISNM